MRYRILILAAVLILTAGCCTAEETRKADITTGEEWTWEPGGYNTFDGVIDLTEFIGREISIHISTDLEYSAEEQDCAPVFTVLNGKRIRVNKQKDFVTLTPDEQTAVTAFTAQLTLPANGPVSQISFLFSIRDADGEELKTCSCICGKTEEPDSSFRINVDMKLITLCLAGAAALVWGCVLVRTMIRKNKKNTGDSFHADL